MTNITFNLIEHFENICLSKLNVHKHFAFILEETVSGCHIPFMFYKYTLIQSIPVFIITLLDYNKNEAIIGFNLVLYIKYNTKTVILMSCQYCDWDLQKLKCQ